MKKFYVLKYGLLACLLLSSILAFSRVNGINREAINKSGLPLVDATAFLKETVAKKGSKNMRGVAPDDPIPTSLRILPQNVALLTAIPQNVKILSINNSLIDYNDQAAVFNQIAVSAGKSATWTKQTRLGKSLKFHYEEGDGNTLDGPSAKLTVRSQPWTHIILQEQSGKPLTDPTEFLTSVKLWQDYIKAYCPNPNAKIIIAMNWPYTDAADFSGTTTTLYNTYMDVAKELGITIAPVGNAYEKIRQIEGEAVKNSLFSDDRHPTDLATYLAACMEYTVIFDSSPININYHPNNISANNALSMQNYAWSTYNEHTDVVNDRRGTVQFTYEILDQFNQPMSGLNGLTWSVNQGGSIDNNGLFTLSGNQPTTVSVTANYGSLTNSATINVVNAITDGSQSPYAEISSGTNYSQNFDALGTSATATLPTGWKIERNNTTPRVVGSYVLSSNLTEQSGGNSLASNALNGIYNFGAGNAATATDRAIGGISTAVAGGTRGINVYLKIKNTGITDLNALNISYDVEKYRMGNNAAGFTVQLYYSVNGETWSSAGTDFRTFFPADGSTAGYSSTPGDNRNISAILYPELAAGDVLYLAWNYSVASGDVASGAQALGIDNVVIEKSNAMPPITYASITSTTGYNQNFDIANGTTVANSQPLPLGWKIERIFTSPRTLGTYNSAAALTTTDYIGGINMVGNSPNGTYNFGAGTTSSAITDATDRAIGGISTGVAGGTRGINTYLKIKNTGQTAINIFNISYDIEKYRLGANDAGYTIQLYYAFDGETWISAGADFRAFFSDDGATTIGYASTPGDTRNINATLNQALAAGKTLYLAWNYSVDSGDDAQGAQALAIDNVSIVGQALLPLKIISFTTQLTGLQNKQTVLNWATAQEKNTDQFLIERSVDGLVFTTIGSVSAKNTSGTHNYSFIDVNPLSGTAYYRLKEIDVDGVIYYSDIRSIKNEEALSVYPNPIIDYVKVKVPGYLQGGNIKISDVMGKTLLTKSNVKGQESVDTSEFGSGTYILEITKGNSIQTFKLVKGGSN